VDSLGDVALPSSLSGPSGVELEALLLKLFGELAALKRVVTEQREEIARLKGLRGRPDIKPSGMIQGTAASTPFNGVKPRGTRQSHAAGDG
jgi:hypothetical protein